MTDIEQRIRAEFDRFGEPPANLSERILEPHAAALLAPPPYAPLPAAPTVTVLDDPDDDPRPERRSISRRSRGWRLAGAGAVAALLGAAVVAVGLNATGTAHRAAAPAAGSVPVELAVAPVTSPMVTAPESWASALPAALAHLQIATVREVEVGATIVITPTQGNDPALEQFDASLVAAAVLDLRRAVPEVPLGGLYIRRSATAPPELLMEIPSDLSTGPAPSRVTIVAAVQEIADRGVDQGAPLRLDRIVLRGTAPAVLVSAHIDAAAVGAGVDTNTIDRVMAGLPSGTSWLFEVTAPNGLVVATEAVTPFGTTASATASATSTTTDPGPIVNTPAGDPASALVEMALSDATTALPHDAIASTTASTTKIVITTRSGSDEQTFLGPWQAELIAIQTRAIAVASGADPPPRFEVYQGAVLVAPGREIPSIDRPWTTADAADARKALEQAAPTVAATITFVPHTGAAVIAHVSGDAGPSWWATIASRLRGALGSPPTVPVLLYIDAPDGLQLDASIPTSSGDEAMGMSSATSTAGASGSG